MSRSTRSLRLGLVAIAAAGVVASVGVGADPAGAEALSVSPTGTFIASARGNGHGHGMSQYGARGAAIAGKNYQQILGFYYPGTTLARLRPSTIRVRLSGFGSTTTVGTNPKLTVTGVPGVLPSTGVSRYRLVASGSGLALQQLRSAHGSTWRLYRGGLANRAEFRNIDAAVIRLFQSSGASTYYHGFLRAVRSGTDVYTVDRTDLNNYTAGVVPRESPASWPIQSLYAQAVAARSYARYEMEHTSRGSEYDICDTTSCQVYGGALHYDSHGNFGWQDLALASRNTANLVLRYRDSTIFAQFSASNGGWTSYGGQPYLPAKPDPYDSTRSGDPYLLYSKTISVAALGQEFGISHLKLVVITRRDGNGAWAGRALAGYLQGLDARNKSKRVDVTGSDLQYALGLGTTWMLLHHS
ncbi:MAG: SpoIID/LytB domain-containing protein [Jatrophihabitans sp.]